VVRGDGRVVAGAQCLQRLVGIRTAGGHLTLHAPQLRAAGGGGAAVVVGAAARLLGLVPQPAGPIPRPAGLLVVLVGRLCGRPRLLQPSRDPAGDLSQRGQPIDRVTPLRFDGAQLRDPLTQHHLGPVEPLQLRGASGQPLIGLGGLGRAVLGDPGEPVEVTRRVVLQPDPQPLPQGRVGADPVGQRGEPAQPPRLSLGQFPPVRLGRLLVVQGLVGWQALASLSALPSVSSSRCAAATSAAALAAADAADAAATSQRKLGKILHALRAAEALEGLLKPGGKDGPQLGL
jgi:hypothetical protein